MTNEELKKKIMSVIYHTFVKYPDDAYQYEHWHDHIADEFISAGYGDVKEAEHRAEVAERALVMSCANMVKDEKSDVNIEQVIRVLYYKYLKQAENELTEERKDE